jgi:hypothetical protein
LREELWQLGRRHNGVAEALLVAILSVLLHDRQREQAQHRQELGERDQWNIPDAPQHAAEPCAHIVRSLRNSVRLQPTDDGEEVGQ